MSLVKTPHEHLDMAEHRLALSGELGYSPVTHRFLDTLPVVEEEEDLDLRGGDVFEGETLEEPVTQLDRSIDLGCVDEQLLAAAFNGFDHDVAASEIAMVLASGRRHHEDAITQYSGSLGDNEGSDFMSGFHFETPLAVR